MLALMCARILTNAPENILTAIGIEDNVAGVAAIHSITFAGTATEAGTIKLYIGGLLNNGAGVDVAVAVGQCLCRHARGDAARGGRGLYAPVERTPSGRAVQCVAARLGGRQRVCGA